jgi:fumarate reductase subunit D
MLVLSYLGFLCAIPLFAVKDSEFVSWHAKQGLTLSLFGLASCALGVLGPLVYLNCAIWPALFVAAVMSILKAFEGQRWRIPVVADLSEKF